MHVQQAQVELETLTVNELRQRFAALFGETTTSRHKQYLIRRILWRLQANEAGGLSRAAVRRARQLASESELRLTAPKAAGPVATQPAPSSHKDTLRPGMLLSREYKGRMIRVAVVEDGFEFEGVRYRSLTAITKAITGSHWNGRNFFGLTRSKE